jgi:hypothetical protein
MYSLREATALLEIQEMNEMKSQIFERLKRLIRGEKQLSLTEREFPVNYEDYQVSWNEAFESKVIKELIETPRREKKLREQETQYQDRLNRERLRKIQEEQKRKSSND